MKTFSKITLMALALFLSIGSFAQGKSAGRGNAHLNQHKNVVVINKREQARVNGAVNANAHANEIAKSNANSNSVLNSSSSTITRHRAKKHHVKKHHAKKHHVKKDHVKKD